jgi:predicted dehydrogenase
MHPARNQARELARLAEQWGLVLTAIHDFRVEPAHWTARELMHTGAWGRCVRRAASRQNTHRPPSTTTLAGHS